MASGQFPRQSSISITWRGKSSRHRSSLWRYVDFPVWLKAGIGQARWPHTSDAYNAWTRRSWTLSCSRVRSWIIMRRAITHYAPPPHPTTRNALLYEWVRQYAGELDYGCIRGNALSFRITFACRTFTLFLYSLLSLLRSALTEIKRSTWPWDSFATNEYSPFVSIRLCLFSIVPVISRLLCFSYSHRLAWTFHTFFPFFLFLPLV